LFVLPSIIRRVIYPLSISPAFYAGILSVS
jgi:hypothetical protein